jgi:RNA-binding protein 5/10
MLRSVFEGQSKGFGFAQFKSTAAAQAFVEPNFPFITLPSPSRLQVNAASSFNSDGNPGRRVKIDYSQSVNPERSRREPTNPNDGTRDIGNTQSAVLLLRGLGDSTTADMVARALECCRSVGTEGSGHAPERVLLVKDRYFAKSLGFAFAEYSDVQVCAILFAVAHILTFEVESI